MIKKILLTVLTSLVLTSPSFATDIKSLSQSINKIIVYTKHGSYVATTFALNYKGHQYLVTNNHVCAGFHSATGAYIMPSGRLQALPPSGEMLENSTMDRVTQYYMQPGSDICIMKSQAKYTGLTLSTKRASPTDQILVSGFVGRSLNLMYVDGKVYGDVPVELPNNLKDCQKEPPTNSSSKLTCSLFRQYPDYRVKQLQTATNNIGPGFSGSPVIKDGQVVGIISAYYPPSEDTGYYNGDAIFFSLEDLQEALDNAKDKQISISGDEYVDILKIKTIDSGVRRYFEIFMNSLDRFIGETLQDND